MEAVIKTGGKQQRVKPGDVIEVELMKGIGETVELTLATWGSREAHVTDGVSSIFAPLTSTKKAAY